MTTNEKPQWEKEFEKTMLITKAGAWLECSDYEGTVIEIRNFIREKLDQARQEERERLAGEVEKLKRPMSHFLDEESMHSADNHKNARFMRDVHNQAVSGVLSLLNSKE